MSEPGQQAGGIDSVIIAGCGYTGSRIATDLACSLQSVVALTVSSTVRIPGVDAVQVDFDRPEGCSVAVGEHSCVIYLTPPPSDGERDTRIQAFLGQVLEGTPRRFVLISTTGVYGDCKGARVDESFEVNPQTDRARRRVDSERQAKTWADQNGVSLAILRVAAIYGPGRVPVERIRNGMTLPSARSGGLLNRVHVDDLVGICIAAIHSGAEGVFNVADGHPLPMIDYLNLVADIWGLPRVNVSDEPADLKSHSVALRQYLSESRSILNDRVLRAFDIELNYPNAIQGLKAVHREMTSGV